MMVCRLTLCYCCEKSGSFSRWLKVRMFCFEVAWILICIKSSPDPRINRVRVRTQLNIEAIRFT
jgi:hypothetical protein